jgi:hypothetical protein
MCETTLIIESFERLCATARKIDLEIESKGLETSIFGQVGSSLSTLSEAECSFHRLISWLYILYRETKLKRDFWFEKFRELFGSDKYDELRRHDRTVGKLRTFFQHNLTSQEDIDECLQWFISHCGEENCGNFGPLNNQAWSICFNELLQESEFFLGAVLHCIENENGFQSCDPKVIMLSEAQCNEIYKEKIRVLGLNVTSGAKNRFRKHYKTLKDDIGLSDFNANDVIGEIGRFFISKIVDDLSNVSVLMIDEEDLAERYGLELKSPDMRNVFIEARAIQKKIIQKNKSCSKEILLKELDSIYQRINSLEALSRKT